MADSYSDSQSFTDSLSNSESYFEDGLQTGGDREGRRRDSSRHHRAVARWLGHTYHTPYSAIPWGHTSIGWHHAQRHLYVRPSSYYHDRVHHITWARNHRIWKRAMRHHVRAVVTHSDLRNMATRRLVDQTAIDSLMHATHPSLPFVSSSMTTVKSPLGGSTVQSVTLNGPFAGISSVHSDGPSAILGSYVNDWKANVAVKQFVAEKTTMSATHTAITSTLGVTVVAQHHQDFDVYSSEAYPVETIYKSPVRWLMKDMAHFLKEWPCFLPLYGVLRFNPTLTDAKNPNNPDLAMVKVMEVEHKKADKMEAEGKRLSIKNNSQLADQLRETSDGDMQGYLSAHFGSQVINGDQIPEVMRSVDQTATKLMVGSMAPNIKMFTNSVEVSMSYEQLQPSANSDFVNLAIGGYTPRFYLEEGEKWDNSARMAEKVVEQIRKWTGTKKEANEVVNKYTTSENLTDLADIIQCAHNADDSDDNIKNSRILVPNLLCNVVQDSTGTANVMTLHKIVGLTEPECDKEVKVLLLHQAHKKEHMGRLSRKDLRKAVGEKRDFRDNQENLFQTNRRNAAAAAPKLKGGAFPLAVVNHLASFNGMAPAGVSLGGIISIHHYPSTHLATILPNAKSTDLWTIPSPGELALPDYSRLPWPSNSFYIPDEWITDQGQNGWTKQVESAYYLMKVLQRKVWLNLNTLHWFVKSPFWKNDIHHMDMNNRPSNFPLMLLHKNAVIGPSVAIHPFNYV
jgi:hypothetical protein